MTKPLIIKLNARDYYGNVYTFSFKKTNGPIRDGEMESIVNLLEERYCETDDMSFLPEGWEYVEHKRHKYSYYEPADDYYYDEEIHSKVSNAVEEISAALERIYKYMSLSERRRDCPIIEDLHKISDSIGDLATGVCYEAPSKFVEMWFGEHWVEFKVKLRYLTKENEDLVRKMFEEDFSGYHKYPTGWTRWM